MSRFENEKQRLISEVIFQMPLLTEGELQELAHHAVLLGRRHAFTDMRQPGAVMHKPPSSACLECQGIGGVHRTDCSRCFPGTAR